MTQDKKTCRQCNHSGMDMDLDPYCAHPNVLEKHPFGLVLHSQKITEFCPSPEHPLWQVRTR